MRKDFRASRPALKRISTGGLVLALMALFGLPTAALAVNETTATTDGADPATITVTALDVSNFVTISGGASSDFITIQDSRAGVAAGGGCTLHPADPDRLQCPKPVSGDVLKVIVHLGDGDDILQVTASAPIEAYGGLGEDNLRGGPDDDILNGGCQVACAADGNDILEGAGGDDVLNGDAGLLDVTRYIGSTDRDVTLDGIANDGGPTELDNVDTEAVQTSGGDDTLIGDAADNVLTSGAGDDSLDGGGGNDTLEGGSGADLLVGGTGTDSVSYNPESRAVSVTTSDGLANDGVIDVDPSTLGNQSEGDNVSSDVESISGGSGNDFLEGGIGAGTIRGNGGNDVLNGGNDTDPDIIIGGGGTDTVTYEGRVTGVNVSLDGIANDGDPLANAGAGENDDVGVSVERIIGGGGNDTLTGNASPNFITGGAGNDTLNGLGGNDRLFGGAGNDTFNGGSGTGDWVDYSGATGAVVVTIDGVANDGEGAESDNVTTTVENVLGGPGDDDITGSTAKNKLTGGLGNDTLTGNAGNDILIGGDGDDTLQGGGGSDTLNGGLGGDVLNGGPGTGDNTSYAGRSSGVTVNQNDGLANDGQGGVAEGDNVFANVERVVGTAHDDDLDGGNGKQVLIGGGGNDNLNGRDGADTLNGGGGDDILVGGFGSDSLQGGAGDDRFFARDLNPPTHPNGYKDSIICGPGADTIASRDTKDVVAASCE
jgi:Ca2+-binding RTX toxin-like protein